MQFSIIDILKIMNKSPFYLFFTLALLLSNCKTTNTIVYNLSSKDLPESEKNLDHAGFIKDFNKDALVRGERVYNATCINCHGNKDNEGSIPMSLKFWAEPFKAGGDAYSMYQTITKGYGSMPPQVALSPQEKYDVIHYIQEEFVSQNKSMAVFSMRLSSEYS